MFFISRSLRVLSSIGFFLLLPIFAHLTAASKAEQLNANNDHGFWLEQNCSRRLNEDWTVNFFTQQRWGSNYRLFWYQEYSLILQCDLTRQIKSKILCLGALLKSFSLAPGFSQISLIRSNTLGKSKWVWISRPQLDLNANLLWNSWELHQRLRLSYVQHNSSHYKNYANARYRMQLFAPWKLTRFSITPYLSNEFFFRKNSYRTSNARGLVGGFYENRFRLGLTANLIKDRFLVSLYWQWRANKKTPLDYPRWWNNYQWGLALNFIF